jgi:Tol biopolymer transport system component
VFDRSRSLRTLATIGTVALAATVALPGIAEASAKTVLISKSGGGAIGNRESGEPSVSRTGRFIAFESRASNLVPGDTNGVHDCFVRDHGKRTTERVSVASDGGESNGACAGPAISADGRFVAFYSTASNLTQGENNGTWDIYLHDRVDGITTRVSQGLGGGAANGPSEDPAISADGRLIAFESRASNLVAGDTNDRQDVFVYDRTTGTTTRVSVSATGGQAVGGDSRDPDLSPDGRFVVFDSAASNLVPNDTNRKRDIFIRDLVTNKTQRVSVNSGGTQGNGDSGNPAVSANGRFVAFDSRARNLVKGDTNGSADVFLRDRKNGTTVRISVSSSGRQATGGWSVDPTISDNGRYITFESAATNLVPKDTNGRWDVFLRDRVSKKTSVISITASGGRTSNGDSDDPAISGDARFIVFESTAPNVVKNDTNRAEDVFRRGPLR